MTAKQLRAIRKRLDLSQKELAKALDCSVDTVKSWEQERNPISWIVAMAIEHLVCIAEEKTK